MDNEWTADGKWMVDGLQVEVLPFLLLAPADMNKWTVNGQ